MVRAFLTSCILLVSLIAAGCIPLLLGGAAATGTYAYVAGEMQVTEHIPMDVLWVASQEAVEDLELEVTERDKDGLTAALTAVGSEDKEIKVRLEKKAPSVTVIRIRVGVFGDEAFSHLVLEKIRQRTPYGDWY